MRRDIAYCYFGLVGVSLAALVVPVPVSVHMLVATVLTIYIGAYGSVPPPPAEPGAAGSPAAPVVQQETFRRKDAYMFPIVGSVVLYSLYLLVKILPRFLLLFLFKFYFVLVGVFTVARRAKQLLAAAIPTDTATRLEASSLTFSIRPLNEKVLNPLGKYWDLLNGKIGEVLAKVPALKNAVDSLFGSDAADEDKAGSNSQPSTSSTSSASSSSSSSSSASSAPEDPNVVTLSHLDLAGVAIAGVVALLYITTNHWLFSNIFGICFSIQAIEMIKLGQFLTGALLLGGLFFYDIFWVFGTEVMVTVAKNVDAPIKLIFPQVTSGAPHAMLGLGDIVIPGIFLSLLLRFDLALNRKEATSWNGQGVRAQYFLTTLAGYAGGLVLTILVMTVFKSAQPALLYLVPACLGASYALAHKQQDVALLLAYSDDTGLDGEGDKDKLKDKVVSPTTDSGKPSAAVATKKKSTKAE